MPLSEASGPPETPGELFPADLLPPPGPAPSDPAHSGQAPSGAAHSGAAQVGPARPGVAARPAAVPGDGSRQLSLFGVESVDASPADLAGLLAGPGMVQRMGGTARVSVRVDAAWRVHALLAELAARGLEASWRPVGPPTADDPAEPAPDGDAAPDVAGHRTQPGVQPAGRVAPTTSERAAVHADGADEDFMADYPDDDPGGPVVGGGPVAGPRSAAAEDTDPEGDDAVGRGAVGQGVVSRDVAGQDVAGQDVAGQDAGGDDARGGGSGADHSAGGSGGAGCFEVRTAYSSLLAGLARSWLDGSAKRAPERFFLTGPRLRLWVVAAGAPDAAGFRLRLGDDDPPQVRGAVVAALAEAGLSGEIAQVVPGGWEARVTGRRRLARLAELVGERPPAVPAGRWPGA